MRAKFSVRIELRDLEKKRTNIRYELDRLQQEWDARNEKILLQKRELSGVKLSLDEAMRFCRPDILSSDIHHPNDPRNNFQRFSHIHLNPIKQ